MNQLKARRVLENDAYEGGPINYNFAGLNRKCFLRSALVFLLKWRSHNQLPLTSIMHISLIYANAQARSSLFMTGFSLDVIGINIVACKEKVNHVLHRRN